jgi:hypothetical protein
MRVTLSVFLLTCICTVGCGPEGGGGGHHGGHGSFGMHHGGLPLLGRAVRMGMRGTRVRGFRRACADDVTRLCPNAKSRKEERLCLEGKRASLDEQCRAALDVRRNGSVANPH